MRWVLPICFWKLIECTTIGVDGEGLKKLSREKLPNTKGLVNGIFLLGINPEGSIIPPSR